MRNTSRSLLTSTEFQAPASVPNAKLRVNCGLIGIGTVGSSVLHFFAEGPLEMRLAEQGIGGQTSVPIHLWSASRRTREHPGLASDALIRQTLAKAGDRGSSRFFYDLDPTDPTSRFNPGFPAWRRVVQDPAMDIVVEVTGSPVAEAIIEEALWNGKCVVTANKKVMSRSGYQLVRLAESRGAVLAYEAAVGGGMPVVQMIGSSVGGRITALLGILNGTTNFILSEMVAHSKSASGPEETAQLYPVALTAAVKLGLAEADPSDDVLGEDSRSKLIILAGLAFGVRLRPADVYIRGIARKGRLTSESIFSASDLAMLRTLGYVPKLLSGAQCHMEGGRERVIAWAQPVGIPLGHPLAGVHGSENACLLRVESPLPPGKGARPFEVMVRGPGAGGPETSSSVISDIQFCARQLAVAGRLSRDGGAGSAAVYNYGAAAFSLAQDYSGIPSLCATDALVASFLLRFMPSQPALGPRVRQEIVAALDSAGIAAREIASLAAPGSLYFRTEPASVRALEHGLEGVLAICGAARISMDILYLPLLDGPAWATAPGAGQ